MVVKMENRGEKEVFVVCVSRAANTEDDNDGADDDDNDDDDDDDDDGNKADDEGENYKYYKYCYYKSYIENMKTTRRFLMTMIMAITWLLHKRAASTMITS